MKWIIYELRIWNQMKLWCSQLWTQFSQLLKEAWKIQDFNGVWTRDLAIPVRRSNQMGIARSRVQTPLKSWIFQASLRNWENCVHNCEDHSFIWFHIRSSYNYDPFHVSFHRWFIPHGNIGTHKWPAPNVSGFKAQSVRASHRYREVMGSNPVEILNFSGFFTQLRKLRS